MPATTGRNANLKTLIQVNTNPSGVASYSEIGGIESIDWTLEDEVQKGFFISDDGFGYSDVTAGRLTVTLSGKRIDTDTAQNYIVGLVGSWGSARKTTLKLTLEDGTVYTIPSSVEITTISGGNAEELEGFECIFHSDGAWTKTALSI